MGADPEPQISILGFNGESPITQANTRRPVSPDFFELQRGMARIAFQQRKIIIGELSNGEG
jgi:hypothetical protein